MTSKTSSSKNVVLGVADSPGAVIELASQQIHPSASKKARDKKKFDSAVWLQEKKLDLRGIILGKLRNVYFLLEIGMFP